MVFSTFSGSISGGNQEGKPSDCIVISLSSGHGRIYLQFILLYFDKILYIFYLWYIDNFGPIYFITLLMWYHLPVFIIMMILQRSAEVSFSHKNEQYRDLHNLYVFDTDCKASYFE